MNETTAKKIEVREEVVRLLLRENVPPENVVDKAESIADYILDGKEKVAPKRYGRLPVTVPGRETVSHEARAWITEDGNLTIEFRREEVRNELLHLIQNNEPVEIVGLSFHYIPAVPTESPVDPLKDN